MDFENLFLPNENQQQFLLFTSKFGFLSYAFGSGHYQIKINLENIID